MGGWTKIFPNEAIHTNLLGGEFVTPFLGDVIHQAFRSWWCCGRGRYPFSESCWKTLKGSDSKDLWYKDSYKLWGAVDEFLNLSFMVCSLWDWKIWYICKLLHWRWHLQWLHTMKPRGAEHVAAQRGCKSGRAQGRYFTCHHPSAPWNVTIGSPSRVVSQPVWKLFSPDQDRFCGGASWTMPTCFLVETNQDVRTNCRFPLLVTWNFARKLLWPRWGLSETWFTTDHNGWGLQVYWGFIRLVGGNSDVFYFHCRNLGDLTHISQLGWKH